MEFNALDDRLIARARLVHSGPRLAVVLAVAGSLTLLERFLVRPAAWAPPFFASGLLGAVLLLLLWRRAILRAEPVPPRGLNMEGNAIGARWWCGVASWYATLWLELTAATALAVVVQFAPGLWVHAAWTREPASFARDIGLSLSPLGELVFELAKDQVWVITFASLLSYLPSRLAAPRVNPQLAFDPIRSAELKVVLGAVCTVALFLVAIALAYLLFTRGYPVFTAHVAIQSFSLVAFFVLYVAWFIRAWRATNPESRVARG